MVENQIHIPEGWESYKFSQVIKKVRNGFSGEQVNYITLFPVTRIETISDGNVNFEKVGYVKNIPTSFQLKLGDILFSNINSIKHIGKLAFVDRDVNLYHGMNLLIFQFDNNIDKKFIYYYLLTRKNWFEKVATQAINQASINQSTLNALELILPKTKSEQQTIANILSKTDQAIAQTEALIAKYTKIKTGLMQDLLTKGIDENGNIRTEQTHEFKDSPLGRIPKEWECVDITKFTKDYNNAIKPGPFGSSVKKEFYVEKGFKIYGQEQVIANNAFIGDYYIDEKKYKSLIGFKVNKDDVLLSCVGTIGSVLIIPENFEEGIINPRLIKFSLDSKKANINFFAEYLTDNSINSQLINLATGGTMPVLNKQIVLSLKFIYPKIEEQNRIVEKWEAVNSMINSEMMKLSKLQSLKTGLMQDLLSGKVRVTSNM